ncbi:MAG: site-2 protease family protein [Bacillota bacterium]
MFAVLIGEAEGFFFCLIATILHEYAHYFVAQKLGMQIGSAQITPFGGMIEIPLEKHSVKENLFVIFAGGSANAIMAIILCAVWWFYPTAYGATYLFAKANVTIALVNFLPCYPLDGGRAWYLWCKEVLKMRNSERFVSIFGIAIGCLFGIAFFMNMTNLTLATLAMFTVLGSEKTLREVSRFSAIKKWSERENLENSDAVAIENVIVASYATRVYKVFFHFKKGGANIVKVRMQNGATKTLSQAELKSAIYKNSLVISQSSTLGDILRTF